MSFLRILFVLTVTTSLMLVSFSFNACNKNSPMQHGEVTEIETTSQFTMLKASHPRLNKAFEQSQWIGTRGGTITVGDSIHGISKLVIPYGAIGTSKDVESVSISDASYSLLASSYDTYVNITFWWESTGFLEGGAEFSPHGLTFNVPVRMELSYKDADLTGVNEDDLKIFYYHEETGEWEIIGDEVDKTNKLVIGYTTHFSRYGVGIE